MEIKERKLYATNAGRKATLPEIVSRRTETTILRSDVIHGQHLGLLIMEDMEIEHHGLRIMVDMIESLQLLQHVISDHLHLNTAWIKRLLVNISSMMIAEGDLSENGYEDEDDRWISRSTDTRRGRSRERD